LKLQLRPEAGSSTSNTGDGLLPIYSVVECEWSSLGHRAFERAVLFALDENPAVITERAHETIDE
jgi:hypothetical protein